MPTNGTMPIGLKTLQSKIVASGVAVMIFLIVGLFLTFWRAWIAVDLERAQRRFAGVASIVAEETRPALTPVVDERRLSEIANRFRIYNPTMDIYLLDAQGTVLSSFNEIDRSHALFPVPPTIMDRFISEGSALPLPFYGPDPREPNRETVFSAAPIVLDGSKYYVYAVLANRSAEHLGNLFIGTVGIRWAVVTAIFLFVAAAILGQLLLAPTMRRFGHIIATVSTLGQRDYSARAEDREHDELGELARKINEMAEQLGDHVEELQQKDLKRRELIANVWHDVRTPVAGVSALAQVLQSTRTANGDADDEVVESLVANAALLGRILSDLRELGRLELGELRPNFEAISLSTVAEELHLAYRPIAERRNVELMLSIGTNIRKVSADRIMIGRAVSNLIENALRYTPEGGKVDILVDGEGDATSIAVEDNGSGIDPGDLPHIFEREYQAQRQSAELQGASGLGLAIVKMIVDAHRGTIHVNSAPGSGTKFALRFPALPDRSDKMRSVPQG